jgi:hypothetical protein
MEKNKNPFLLLMKNFKNTLFGRVGFGPMFLMVYLFILLIAVFLLALSFIPFLVVCSHGGFLDICIPIGFVVAMFASFPGYLLSGFLNFSLIPNTFFNYLAIFITSYVVYFVFGSLIDIFVFKKVRENTKGTDLISNNHRVSIISPVLFYAVPIIISFAAQELVFKLKQFNILDKGNTLEYICVAVSVIYLALMMFSLITFCDFYCNNEKDKNFILKYFLPLFAWYLFIMIITQSFLLLQTF